MAELDSAAESFLISCDVTDRQQVQGMVNAVLDRFGGVDVLIYAAGMNVAQRGLRSLDPADWDRVIAANLIGAFNVLHAALPSMRSRGNGLIVQISSLSGLRANTVSGVAYSASKFAQSALGTCISREERGRGIRSTVIHAGEVNTQLLDSRAFRPGGMEEGRRAATVRFLVDLPAHAHVPKLVIKPTIDDFA